LSDAEIIVEAVTEDLDLKGKIVFEVSRATPAGTILASNTSSFSISEMARASASPESFIGLHFFNPPDRMPLVEVITHERTSPEILRRAMAVSGQLGKVPVVVKDSPGFLINRLLGGFLLEAARMAYERVPLNWIERAAVNFGMPMGPLVLFDELGWDLTSQVGRQLHLEFGERLKPPPLMNSALATGLSGKSTAAGFYLWDAAGRKLGFNRDLLERIDLVVSDEQPGEDDETLIRDRLILPMIDEAARCLAEKIVRKPKDVDLAIIIGIGFPPFRGGLLRYADELGIDYVTNRLGEIYTAYRPHRQVSEMLSSMREAGRSFYGLGSSG
jgi:3-hydroxyacyl-CoA dehydrogenase/enoyl-CoA hydratase/3-hydroxybutyryl-CoA epimerase